MQHFLASLAQKKKSWSKLKVSVQTGWRLKKVKSLLNCRKIQWNHSYRDTPLWWFPIDEQSVYSVGVQTYIQRHKIFPEQDTNLTTFVLSLKSPVFFFPLPKIPAFWSGIQRPWWASPCPSAPSHHHCHSPLPPCTVHPSKSKQSPGHTIFSAISEAFSVEPTLTWLRFPLPIWLFSSRSPGTSVLPKHVLLSWSSSYLVTLFPVYSGKLTAQAVLLPHRPLPPLPPLLSPESRGAQGASSWGSAHLYPYYLLTWSQLVSWL